MNKTNNLRYNWTRKELLELYKLPFPELMLRAQIVHRENFDPSEVQRSTLLSIKTGACPENCSYCPQSAHHETEVKKQPLMDKENVLAAARQAKKDGASRFCMGAAWREVKDGPQFDSVIDLVQGVHDLGLEVCCTLGMLNENQAERLKNAGCYAYNHNLDTSPEYYPEIITTRTYQERLDTIKNVRKAGLTVCCGGILGMGESLEDRMGLIEQLATQQPHPESVPVNMLVRVEGTPLSDKHAVDPFEFIRVIAVARICMPHSMVRLSAGRTQMSDEMQALCFLAGANSVFSGDKLLTTENPSVEKDLILLEKLGMKFAKVTCAVSQHSEAHV